MEAKIIKGLSIQIEEDLFIYIIKSGNKGQFFVVEDDPYPEDKRDARLMIVEEIVLEYSLDLKELEEKMKEIFKIQ
jgi:hypothetical protein